MVLLRTEQWHQWMSAGAPQGVEKSPSPAPVKVNVTAIGEALPDWSDTTVMLSLGSGAGEKPG